MVITFDEISSVMSNKAMMFIIPTFQRPYAWGETQVKQLHRDLKKMHEKMHDAHSDAFHYLAPMHLIKLPTDDKSPLYQYLPKHHDIEALKQSRLIFGNNFAHDEGPLRVYLVVDGQQRLTIIYLLHHFMKSGKGNLYVKMRTSGYEVPRLILNDAEDHNFMKKLMANITTTNSIKLTPKDCSSQAQRRLLATAKTISKWSPPHSVGDFDLLLQSPDLKTLLIELEPGFGLTAFQTLNDRGKPLTSLEKFKALLLEYDFDYNKGNSAYNIHVWFGNLYEALDDAVFTGFLLPEAAGDDQLMQLLITYLYISDSGNIFWYSGERAYEFLREELQNASDHIPSFVPGLIERWTIAINEFTEQFKHLISCLSGKSPTLPSRSSFYVGRTSRDDYSIIIKSLRLDTRLIALLLKFRHQYNVEWHEKFEIPCQFDPKWLSSIRSYLDQIKAASRNTHVIDKVNSLISELNCLSDLPREGTCKTSMLEVVERIELMMFRRGNQPGWFRNQWNTVFCPTSTYKYDDLGNSKEPTGVQSWCTSSKYNANGCVQSWYKGTWYQEEFPDFVQNGGFSDPVLRYILREYEAELNSGANIHFDSDLTLEHIFPQNPASNPPAGWGFSDPYDYQKFLWRIGNLTFVRNNSGLGNNLPDIKSSCYVTPPPIQPEITKKVGNELTPLATDYPEYRLMLLARCTELAIFCWKRFFCR